MQLINLGWGNPYFILEQLEKHQNGLIANVINTKECAYGPDQGLPDLINLTHMVIAKTTGLSYKHLLITNGATSAINSILRVNKSLGMDKVLSGEFGYPLYPNMIEKAGLAQIPVTDWSGSISDSKTFALIDSPSNPLGLQTKIGSPLTDVWDSVYHNNIYTEDLKTIPGHKVMVGSYSKLLGLAGFRVGWIATNDELYYNLLMKDSISENATTSVISQKTIVELLQYHIDLDEIIGHSKRALDFNRECWSNVLDLFDGQPMQSSGMFYLAQADKNVMDLLDSCMIQYVKLTDSYIRISLGQTNDLMKEATLRILRKI